MAEVITETIVPGTYIEVRAEGLLSVGAISTGNVGVIGTAEKGTGQVQRINSSEDARARFGEDTWDASAADDNLSLVKAIKLLFDNGANTVYAKRVLDETKTKVATYQLKGPNKAPLLTLKAKTPGTWANRLEVRVENADSQTLVTDELVAPQNGAFMLSSADLAKPETPGTPVGKIVVHDQGRLSRYQLKTDAASPSSVQVSPTDRRLTFLSQPSSTAKVYADYWVPGPGLRKITLRYGNMQEVYFVPSVTYLAQRLQAEESPSKLVEVDQVNQSGLPEPMERFDAFVGGDNGTVALGDFQTALDALVEQDVQLVLVVGKKFTDIQGALLGHLEKTENLGHERIAVVGADKSHVEKILENANGVADKRLVLVAPGLRQRDPQTDQLVNLPPPFAAAAIAGKLSSLSPHISLTNKTLAGIDGLTMEYNYGELKALLQNRVLVLQRKRGVRVVKGISTDDEAFKQISVRRIVDYIKQGTRMGANQYIGKLNNKRVRENLRTTLDGFLSDLVIREFLTGYKLKVFADRAMEIRGEVLVTMDLNPTFSIDVIRVIMNLS